MIVTERPRAILLDVEGTTTSVAFVHDVLFPYARARLEAFVRAHVGDPEVRAVMAEADVATLLRWMDEDRKATPLKTIQGLVWREGYASGALRGHVYEDAAKALRAWHERGISLWVFSSGSIEAQRLLFSRSDHGDLGALFSGHFDTTTGPKHEPASYAKIARSIGVDPKDVLFFSDAPREIDAARAAGMRALEVRRDGAPAPEGAIERLDRIAFP